MAAAGWFAWRVDRRARALLAPAYITRGADAKALVDPPLSARAAAILHPPTPAPATPRLVALTFDDGPYPVTTPLLLDRLRDLDVPATFFLIGHDARQFPSLTRMIARAGNEVANHTFTHPDLDKLDDAAVTSELAQGRGALLPLTNDLAAASRMRPPHGRYTEATVRAIQRAGYDTVLWNDDPGDWRTLAPQTLAAHLFAHATAPEIILLHSGKMSTIEALDDIVRRYRAAGYRFVTVGALLREAGVDAINHPVKVRLGAGA